MPIKELFDLYLQWVAENRSAKTLSMYRYFLTGFAESYANRPLESLSPAEVHTWLQSAFVGKRGQRLAPDTRRSIITAFQAFEKWAIGMKQLSSPICEKIEKPRGRRRERLPTAEEVEQLLAVASREYRMAYQALRQSGMRPGELAMASFENYDREKGVIVLKQHKTANKVGKPRVIPVGQKLAELIDESLGDRTEGPLFVTRTGRPWTTAKLSTQFRQCKKKAGITDPELVQYSARHEAATRICKNSGIRDAAAILGHASITTTQRYDHPDIDDLRRKQDL